MVAIRPPVDEFDDWSPADGHWGRAAVLECFRRLEDDLMFGDRPYHGRGGPIAVSRAPLEEWAPLDHAHRDSFMALGHPWMPDGNAPAAPGSPCWPTTPVTACGSAPTTGIWSPGGDGPI